MAWMDSSMPCIPRVHAHVQRRTKDSIASHVIVEGFLRPHALATALAALRSPTLKNSRSRDTREDASMR